MSDWWSKVPPEMLANPQAADSLTHLRLREEAKERAARAAVALVEDGMRLGLGTGSTADYMLTALAERVREGLRISAVPTSAHTAERAQALGIPLTTLDETPELDLAIDGADEVDPGLNLIKGGGGALLREKIVAACAARFFVIVDPSKRVERLGAYPLPVEIIAMAAAPLSRLIAGLGAVPTLRRNPGGANFLSDEGHPILDCAFGQIADPPALAAKLAAMPGVVEHGLFCGMADLVLVGGEDGVERLVR